MTPDIGFSWNELIVAVFVAGGFWAELKAIRKDIRRLEQKQDKYNNLQERTHILEIWREQQERK